MSERDELAEDIAAADRLHKDDPVDPTIHYSHVIADELLAAGYRKCSGQHWVTAPTDDSGW